METIYLGMVIFLFLLAIFDLWVGVSNDAVNFLNSAIGSKAAKFHTIIAIAGLGVFCGAVMSDGMMDIARHGVFKPEMFYFKEIMYILLAVMVTDMVLLDVFNTLGMPTSTTVSLVFEMLGATFALSMFKMFDPNVAGSTFGDFMNTDKALQMIVAIFLSVAIAFVFGSLIQYLARIVFTFNYRSKLRWKIGIFGGLAVTSIVYFMLFKGMKHLSFMTDDVLQYVNENILMLLGCCFVFFTIFMQILHFLKVNVLRVVVLIGTFALATAFAGNDLVNFLGVPLAGLSSYEYWSAAGCPDSMSFLMNSLNDPADTHPIFLYAAGAIMVTALATSKKAHNVVKTSISLSSKDEGDEMFGSSRMARSLVRWGNSVGETFNRVAPLKLRRYIDSRFQEPTEKEEVEGVTFDLVRASINLVVAALLIALGTSLKLPLSTTYVTFMVAMGSSLADRAWSRESAVFRITGVLTVIGGWLITAGVAFTACFFVALAMYYGGIVVSAIIVAGALYALFHSQRMYKKKQAEMKQGDVLFTQMLKTQDKVELANMLEKHFNVATGEMVSVYANAFDQTVGGLFEESLKPLRRSAKTLEANKRELKNLRRREMICLRRTEPATAVALSTPFHLVHNSLRQIHFALLRINEPAREHVDNNFSPIDKADIAAYTPFRNKFKNLAERAVELLRQQNVSEIEALREEFDVLRDELVALRRNFIKSMQREDVNLTTATLYLHTLQETEQIVVELRNLLRSVRHFHEYVVDVTAKPEN